MTLPHGMNRYKNGPDQNGTEGKGCRCPQCRAASAAYMRHRHRMITYGRWQPYTDAAGTRRRIQALVWNGWSLRKLAALLDWKRPVLQHKLRSPRVATASAEKVRALYDRLWNQPPPETTKDEKRAAAMARRYAREHGWVPPLAWWDDQIDDPDAQPVAGWERRERRDGKRQPGVLAEEAAELLAAGEAMGHVAERLGVTLSTLSTVLSRARKEAVAEDEAA